MDRYFDLFTNGDGLRPMPTIANSLGERLADLEEQYKALQKENDRLKERLTIYERKEASNLRIIRDQEKRLKEVCADRTRIISQLDEKNEQISSLQRKNTNLEASNETYKKLVASLEKQKSNLTDERDLAVAQANEKDKQINVLRRMNRNLTDSNEALRNLVHKTKTKTVTIDDLLEKLQEPKPQPKPEPKPEMSEEDSKTLNRFKELMGDVSGFSGPEIVQRFLGTCLVMALEDEDDEKK